MMRVSEEFFRACNYEAKRRALSRIEITRMAQFPNPAVTAFYDLGIATRKALEVKRNYRRNSRRL